MNDNETLTQGSRVVSADTAALIIGLVEKVEAAHVESDELAATVSVLREQRAILMQRVHEFEKQTKQQRQRIATLCDENRALRAQVAEWIKAAA